MEPADCLYETVVNLGDHQLVARALFAPPYDRILILASSPHVWGTNFDGAIATEVSRNQTRESDVHFDFRLLRTEEEATAHINEWLDGWGELLQAKQPVAGWDARNRANELVLGGCPQLSQFLRFVQGYAHCWVETHNLSTDELRMFQLISTSIDRHLTSTNKGARTYAPLP